MNITLSIIANPVLLGTDTLHPFIREHIERLQAQQDKDKTGIKITWVHLYLAGDESGNFVRLERVILPDGTVDWRRIA